MYSDTDVMNPNTPVGSTSIGEVGVGVASGGTVFFGPDQYRHANEIQTNRKQFEVAGYYDIGDHAITLGYKKMENDMFNMFSRNELKKMIEEHGGKNVGSISKSTTFVLAGENMGPSKKEKAESLGVNLVNEDEFLAKIS